MILSKEKTTTKMLEKVSSSHTKQKETKRLSFDIMKLLKTHSKKLVTELLKLKKLS